MAQPSSSQSSGVFKSLQAYPFHTDPEFANGLAIILGHPSTPATEAEMNREDDLVLQAKCFFYSRYPILRISDHFAHSFADIHGTCPQEREALTAR